MRLLRCALVLSLAVTAACAGRANTMPEDGVAPKPVDAIVRSALLASHGVGAEVVVLRGDEVVANKAYGYYSLRSHRAMRRTSLLPLGSITKSVTARAVLDAAEGGRFDVNAAIGRYVSLPDPLKNVTISSLLHQTSGIPDYNDERGREALLPLLQQKDEFKKRLISYLNARRPGPARTGFQYSNSNYMLLGSLLEATACRRVADCLQHALTMRNIGPSEMRYPSNGDAAPGYFFDGFTLASEPADPVRWSSSAGALVGTAEGIARWAEVSWPTEKNRKNISSSTYDGWFEDDGVLGRELYHGGQDGGFRSACVFLPDLQLAVGVLSNTSTFDALATARRIAYALHPFKFGSPQPDVQPAEFAKEWLTQLQLANPPREAESPALVSLLTPEYATLLRNELADYGWVTQARVKNQARVGAQRYYDVAVTFEYGATNMQFTTDAEHRVTSLRLTNG